MSTTLPVTVSAKTGALNARTAAAIVNPVNILRIEILLPNPTDSLCLYHVWSYTAPMKNILTLAAVALGGAAVLGAQSAPASRVVPTVDQILSLKRAGSPEISPDGRLVAYTVREANWDDNAYETEIWLADATSGATRQLTNAKKSSQSPAWSPDGSKLAFVSDRSDKRQIYLISPQGGEADALDEPRRRRHQFLVVARRQGDRVFGDRAKARRR